MGGFFNNLPGLLQAALGGKKAGTGGAIMRGHETSPLPPPNSVESITGNELGVIFFLIVMFFLIGVFVYLFIKSRQNASSKI